jgi:cytochrome c-type biogenesis protein CcmH
VAEALSRVDPGAVPPGPTSADIASAETLSEGERSAMIEGMVGQLAARLKDEPSDVEGWLRLIRSYVVLGKSDAAAEAARAALEGVADETGRGRVEALIADLGVTPAVEATP